MRHGTPHAIKAHAGEGAVRFAGQHVHIRQAVHRNQMLRHAHHVVPVVRLNAVKACQLSADHHGGELFLAQLLHHAVQHCHVPESLRRNDGPIEAGRIKQAVDDVLIGQLRVFRPIVIQVGVDDHVRIGGKSGLRNAAQDLPLFCGTRTGCDDSDASACHTLHLLRAI